MADITKRLPDCDDDGERGERGKRGKRGKRGQRGHDGRDGDTGPAGPGGPAIVLVGPTSGPGALIAAEDLPAGSPISLNEAGQVILALPATDTFPGTEVIGVVSQDTAAGQVVQFVAAGPLTLDAATWDAITGGSGGLVPGATYYQSLAAPGRLTLDPASGLAVGIASSPSTFLIRICCRDIDAFIFDPSGSRGAIQNNGTGNRATGTGAVAEGAGSNAESPFAHAEGFGTNAGVDFSHSEGFQTVTGNRGFPGLPGGPLPLIYGAHAEGVRTRANNIAAHAEGDSTTASGLTAHAEGFNTTASGSQSHAEGLNSIASGSIAHAEGNNTTASGSLSHAEGSFSVASGPVAHAEGDQTTASGYASHAEGINAVAIGQAAHAQGEESLALRESQDALASGNFTTNGDAQTSNLVLRGSTPGAVANETVELKYGLAGDQTFQLEDGKTYAVKVVAAAGGVRVGTESRVLELSFNARRVAGVSTIEGAQLTASYGSAGAALWTLTASIGAPDRVVLTFDTGPGVPSKVNVAARVEFTEVLMATE